MKDNANEMLPLVDEAGNVTGQATRGECHAGSMLLHPVVHLHLFNSEGELYLQRRPAWKDIQPCKWDTAVGGHIDLGETVDGALRRETIEEIGLTGLSPQFLGRYVFQSARERELINVFKAVSDEPPVPSDELGGGRFFSHAEIAKRLRTGFFTPNFEQEWEILFS